MPVTTGVVVSGPFGSVGGDVVVVAELEVDPAGALLEAEGRRLGEGLAGDVLEQRARGCPGLGGSLVERVGRRPRGRRCDARG